MPTVPRKQPEPPPAELHKARLLAESFGTDAAGYDRARPGYPDALVEREARHWDPVLFWAADTLGAHFILAEGIVHVRQPDSAIAAQPAQ